MKNILSKMFTAFMAFSILLSGFVLLITVNAAENATSNITLSLSGEGLEYNIENGTEYKDGSTIRFSINGANPDFNLKSNQITYTYDGEEINGYTSNGAYSYVYNKEGETVTFNFSTQWDDAISYLKINETEYITEEPTKDELIARFDPDTRGIEFDIEDVPYAESYNIVIVAGKQTEKIMGNFGWSYNVADPLQQDEIIPHGKLEFVQAEYGGNTYTSVAEINELGGVYEWTNGVKKSTYEEDDRTGIGEAMFPTGTVLTLKLIPDTGYQLVSLDLNGQEFEPGEVVGTYTFTVPGGNFHISAQFVETENVVNTTSESVQSGSIDIDLDGESSFEHGTAKLEVSDVDPNTKEDFEEELPEGYEITSYVDISLYNSVYKGTNDSNDSWDSEVDSLDNNATVTLTLSDDIGGEEFKVIHETHEGSTITGYEVIDATYDQETNTISFETDGFSNYAIISTSSNDDDEGYNFEVEDSEGNSIEFNKQDDHTYTFGIISYIGLTDEQLDEFGMTRSEYTTLYNGIENAVKTFGNIIDIYELSVTDEDDVSLHEGPFRIKIKMTEEMKKYEAFCLVYTDIDNEFATEEPIELTVEGDYLVGELEHLSVYAIIGNEAEDSPKTGDGIVSSIILGCASLVGLTLCILFINKKKIN